MATPKVGERKFDNRSGRIIRNVMPMLILLDRNLQDANFLTFFSRVPAENTRAENFKWDVDEYLAVSDAINNGSNQSATDVELQVDNAVLFNPGQVFMNRRTGEHIGVTGQNVGNNRITVIRGITALESAGGTAAAIMLDNDVLVRMAPAVGEINTRQQFQHTIPANVDNNTQAFRWEVSLSRRQIKRSFDSQDAEMPYLMEKTMLEARKQLNGTFLVQEKGAFTDATEGYKTLTCGSRPQITSFPFAVGGTLYQAAFDEWLVKEGLRKGSRNKILFASNDVILAITEMANDLAHHTIEMGTTKTSFGLQVLGYTAPNGRTILIVEDRFLSDNFVGEAYLCDMTQLKRRVFSNHGINDDLHIVSDTGDTDDMGTTNTMLADMGLQWGAEAAHGKLTGVSGGAKGRALS